MRKVSSDYIMVRFVLLSLLGAGQVMAGERLFHASHDEIGLGGLNQWGVGLNLEAEFEPVEPEPGTGLADEQSPEMNLDRFLLSGQVQGVSFRLGHHRPAPRGLLFDGRSGWGVSADASLEPLNGDLRVFGVSAESNAAGKTDFSVPDEAYYAGSRLQSRLSLFGQDARITAGYVSGREPDGVVSAADGLEASMSRGLGYSLGLSTAFLDRRLSLDVATARSRFGQTDSVSGRDPGDSAYSASLVYTPELAWAPLNWKLGAEADRVGGGFYSPGNRYLATDRAEERLFLRMNPLRDWSLGYSYGRRGKGIGQHWLDSRGSQIVADGTLQVSDRLRLTPSGSFQREEYPERDATRYRSHLSLSANTWLIPDSLAYRNTISFNRVSGSEDPLLVRNERRRQITGEFQWQALRPIRHRPGLDLNLSFSADHREWPALEQGGLQGYRVQLSISSSTAET